MLIKKSAIARIYSYSIGIVIQLGTILLLTSKLEIYQISIWGVTIALIFISSTVTQLSYSQNIEKYFPNLDNLERKRYLFKYFKTVIATLPLVLLVLFTLEYFNYFIKFNANKITYLIVMIALWSTLESLLSLFDNYFIATKNNIKYDLSDLYIYKLPRFVIFYLLIVGNYSVFYLIAVSVLLRFILFIYLFQSEFKLSVESVNYFKHNSIFKDNFKNFSYNIVAYSNNVIYISFVNILYLVSNVFNETIDIAHFSLIVVIINNLRPIMNSIPSLLTPVISNLVSTNSKNKEIVERVEVYSQIFVSLILIISLLIIENKILIQYFLQNYFDGIYKLIYLSIFSSVIRSQYFTDYLNILFSKNEKKILFFNIKNIIIVTILFLIISIFKPINFVYIYIIYELNFLIYIKYLNSKKFNLIRIFENTSFIFIFTIFISFLYFVNIFNLNLFIVLPYIIFKDIKKYKILK